jgi:tRNA-splicing ligase RtcB
MGRNQARKVLNLEEEQKKMEGIVHSIRNEKDLDEAPGAYKDINIVIEEQLDLVEVVTILKPLAVIKA